MAVDIEAEIGAIGKVAEALEELDPEVRRRVLRWAAERFEIELPNQPGAGGQGGGKGGSSTPPPPAGQGNLIENPLEVFSDFASLYDAAKPSTDVERALVSAYWVGKGNSDVVSQDVNTELKNLGYPIANITDAMTGLIDRKPGLLMQTAKSGSTRQARKKYRITAAGISKVKRMLAGSDSPDPDADAPE